MCESLFAVVPEAGGKRQCAVCTGKDRRALGGRDQRLFQRQDEKRVWTGRASILQITVVIFIIITANVYEHVLPAKHCTKPHGILTTLLVSAVIPVS